MATGRNMNKNLETGRSFYWLVSPSFYLLTDYILNFCVEILLGEIFTQIHIVNTLT